MLAASHNGFSQQANIEGLQKLKDKGMLVYQPTKEDMAQYRDLAQPAALTYLKEKVGQEWVDKALAAAKKGEQAVGDKADQIIKDHIKLANDKYAEWVKK
jgi:C4-dicarboxylate-binding protein DctP